jgi:hypothetical protein
MKLSHRFAMSIFAGLVAFVLIGSGATALNASAGTSYEQRITRLEQLAEINQLPNRTSIPATTRGCS